MTVCGIELKGNNAILSCLSGDAQNYEVIAKDIRKIGLADTKVQENIKSFSSTINQFFKEMNIDRIAIKARAEKGKFAGGATSFKIEGLIQNTEYSVEIIHGATIKSKLKGIDTDLSIVNKYQQESLKLAIFLLQ